MESLREEKSRLVIALSTARKEQSRAMVRLNAGTFTFRMYLEFVARVEELEEVIAAVDCDIMSQ